MSLPFIPTSEVNSEPAQETGYQMPLDINQLLIDRPATTFLLCSGVARHGVQPGDILVVDRGVEPRRGQLVVAVHEGELQLMRYPAVEVWGAVTYVIHKT